MRAVLVAVLSGGVSGFVEAGAYACKEDSGRMSFSDRPCAAQSGREETRVPHPPDPLPPATLNAGAPPPYRPPGAVDVPPLPDAAELVSALPKNAHGQPVLGSTGPAGAELVLERTQQRGPLQVLAACSSLVSRCYRPGERELDACFFSAPRCRTEEPWRESVPCCPESCWDAYEQARKRGQAPLTAFDSVLFGAESCVSGVAERKAPP